METPPLTETVQRPPFDFRGRPRSADPVRQTCEHAECCRYFLCAHPKCCGYAVMRFAPAERDSDDA